MCAKMVGFTAPSSTAVEEGGTDDEIKRQFIEELTWVELILPPTVIALDPPG